MSTNDRWQSISAPHGAASLRHTHWLDAEPRSYDGAPGEWWAEDGQVRGRGLPDGEVRLDPFASVTVEDLLLRAFVRDDALALRVYDPAAPSRTTLRGIASHLYDPSWIVEGQFEPAPEGSELLVRSVDGYERTVAAVGTVHVTVRGTEMHLSVTGDSNGLSAVIADADTDGYPFRFLEMPAPDASGRVSVDLTAAYLPPCAFSDQYVCPLPPAQNRFPFVVEAGERRVIRD